MKVVTIVEPEKYVFIFQIIYIYKMHIIGNYHLQSS